MICKKRNKTTIVILGYKEYNKFKKMFETLIKNTHYDDTPFEIILISNNAEKDIQKYINHVVGEYNNIDPRICIKAKFNTDNIGTSKGFNIAGSVTDNKNYICFFNSDYYMMDNWLPSMIDCFEHKPQIGLIGCSTNATGNVDEKCEDESKLIGDYKESECAIAQMFTTQKIWKQVKGFNEDLFPVGFEDLDFNERIKKKKYKIFVNRKCFGYHDYEPTKEYARYDDKGKNRAKFVKLWGNKYKWA